MAKAPVDIRSLARAHTNTAINTLVSIMRMKDAPPAARVSASCALLDRGWGKPEQSIEGNMVFGPSDAMIEFLRAVGRGEYVGKEATIINSVPLLAEGAKEPAE